MLFLLATDHRPALFMKTSDVHLLPNVSCGDFAQRTQSKHIPFIACAAVPHSRSRYFRLVTRVARSTENKHRRKSREKRREEKRERERKKREEKSRRPHRKKTSDEDNANRIAHHTPQSTILRSKWESERAKSMQPRAPLTSWNASNGTLRVRTIICYGRRSVPLSSHCVRFIRCWPSSLITSNTAADQMR